MTLNIKRLKVPHTDVDSTSESQTSLYHALFCSTASRFLVTGQFEMSAHFIPRNCITFGQETSFEKSKSPCYIAARCQLLGVAMVKMAWFERGEADSTSFY